ncbi:TPA: hypothetical protein R4160_004925, partial [Enterobacter hormaechei subsp. xiangfangensis]|nr:hypothetical protein [Enterobacter hormaechei subsp. xiangfangensis]
ISLTTLLKNRLLQNITETAKAQDRQPQTHFLEVVEIVMVAAIAAAGVINND